MTLRTRIDRLEHAARPSRAPLPFQALLGLSDAEIDALLAEFELLHPEESAAIDRAMEREHAALDAGGHDS